jgi:hypothetical protein
MRREFTMTQDQCDKLFDACAPSPTVQANVNAAWEALGAEIGFETMSSKPVPGKGMEVFTAEAIELEAATETSPSRPACSSKD